MIQSLQYLCLLVVAEHTNLQAKKKKYHALEMLIDYKIGHALLVNKICNQIDTNNDEDIKNISCYINEKIMYKDIKICIDVMRKQNVPYLIYISIFFGNKKTIEVYNLIHEGSKIITNLIRYKLLKVFKRAEIL